MNKGKGKMTRKMRAGGLFDFFTSKPKELSRTPQEEEHEQDYLQKTRGFFARIPNIVKSAPNKPETRKMRDDFTKYVNESLRVSKNNLNVTKSNELFYKKEEQKINDKINKNIDDFQKLGENINLNLKQRKSNILNANVNDITKKGLEEKKGVFEKYNKNKFSQSVPTDLIKETKESIYTTVKNTKMEIQKVSGEIENIDEKVDCCFSTIQKIKNSNEILNKKLPESFKNKSNTLTVFEESIQNGPPIKPEEILQPEPSILVEREESIIPPPLPPRTSLIPPPLPPRTSQDISIPTAKPQQLEQTTIIPKNDEVKSSRDAARFIISNSSDCPEGQTYNKMRGSCVPNLPFASALTSNQPKIKSVTPSIPLATAPVPAAAPKLSFLQAIQQGKELKPTALLPIIDDSEPTGFSKSTAFELAMKQQRKAVEGEDEDEEENNEFEDGGKKRRRHSKKHPKKSHKKSNKKSHKK
jgi:hypothetical protein